jgi:predicted dinucleotide-binding enzyme
MKIGIFGTGDVGRALGRAFVTLGNETLMGSRAAGNDKARAWVAEAGPKAKEGTFADAAAFADVVVLATLGAATEDAIEMAGPERLRGKVIIDATNPLDFSGGMPPKLFVGHTDSLGERIQRLCPDAHVVKCFNTVGNASMFRPAHAGGPPTMFICGNSDDAKGKVGAILKDFGWDVADIGGIEGSRELESMCLLWVRYALRSGVWTHAFKLLPK